MEAKHREQDYYYINKGYTSLLKVEDYIEFITEEVENTKKAEKQKASILKE